MERQVRNDSERLVGKRDLQKVTLDDRVEASAERSYRGRIKLNRDDTRAASHERRREHPATRAEVQDELARPNAGVLDDRVGNRVASEEVSCVSRRLDPRSAGSNGHGRTPRSLERSRLD